MIRKHLGFLRGESHTESFELEKVLVMGMVDADVLGFHWTLWAYGWPGRQICIAQGRSFTLAEGVEMLRRQQLAHRWWINRRVSTPAGVKVEFNFRRWICDFFRIP